ncbi:MAG: glycoside hydrolase family 9 protein [Pseudomonadota bacterium]
MSTKTTVSFVDDTTIQIRFALGEVDKARITTDIPTGVNFNAGDGYGFAQADGTLVGRLVGLNNEYFMPLDGFTPSAIEDLFAWSEVGGARAAAVDVLNEWSITVGGMAAEITGISRKANITETATTGWSREFATVHSVFLELAAPMTEGAALEIGFNDPDFEAITARYTPDTTISEAVHVNLAGYDPDSGAKMAYLSSWNGFEYAPGTERGGLQAPQAYAEGMTFDVIDEATGAVVLTGQTALAQGVNDGTNFWQNYAGTDVFAMDISALSAEGIYHIVVDGVGRSQSFEVDDDHYSDLFGLTFKGYYHQRSGIALTEEYTDFVRPAGLNPNDGITVHQTTVKLTETSEAWNGSLPKPFEFWEGNLTGETLDDAWGGWHDAGDFDRRTQHMETARKLIELHELHTTWSEGFDGNIPESANDIPDLLDEAIWGTMVFRRLQHDDGGVPGGIESESYGSLGGASFTDGRDLYAYAPDAWSSWEYAATAAKIARALEPYDAAEAAAWLASGVAAFDWAENQEVSGDATDLGFYNKARNIAATELYETTGEEAYHDIFLSTFVYSAGGSVAWYEAQYEAAFAYARNTQSGADSDVQAAAQAALQERGDFLLEYGTNSGFGFIADPYAPYGWGNTATQPTNSSEILLRLHALTGDDAYIPIVQRDIDYAFGANPMNMSFVTGLDQIVDGVRQPEEILHAESEVLGTAPPPGITLYGEYNIYDYGWTDYHSEMWLDTWPNYYDTPVHESWNGNYGYVPVTEFTVMQGMEDMTFVTGYLAALEAEGGSSETVFDTAGNMPWAEYTKTYGAGGVMVKRETLYDDGRTSEIDFGQGAARTIRWTDPEDAHSWQSRSATYGADGTLLSQGTLLDDGRNITQLYEGGVQVSRTTRDTADVFAFASITLRTDESGEPTLLFVEMDDGRTIETRYTDGVRSSREIIDVQDAFDWAAQSFTYDASGAVLTRVITPDTDALL